MSKQTITNKKSRHINLRYHHVRSYSDSLIYVNTDDNRADGLTKPVPGHVLIKIFHHFPNR